MNQKIKGLFISYLEKDISPDDEATLLQWVNENTNSVKKLNDFRQIWNSSGNIAQLGNNSLQNEWGELLGKIVRTKSRKNQPKSIKYWLPRMAIIFLFGAVFSFAISYTLFNGNREIVFNKVESPAGAKSKVTLPDGSVVWLNAGSTLKYSNQFNEKRREVYLTGEALFKVKKNRKKIFVVSTSELKIKAYGTSFNVKSYPEESTIEATLLEGSIGITRTLFKNKRNDEVMLKPNQRVVYYRKNRHVKHTKKDADKAVTKTNVSKHKLTYLVSKEIDTQQFVSWKDGVLFIDSETLKELAVKLERKYDVKIHFETEHLENLIFTGSLENETIEQVIDAIGIAAKIKYTIKDRDIWLKENESK